MDNYTRTKEEYNFSDLKELSDKLTREDIGKLHEDLNLPRTVFNEECDGVKFILALKEWSGFDPSRFYQSLNLIRPDMIRLALHMDWLCVLTDQRCEINFHQPYNELYRYLIKEKFYQRQPRDSFKVMPDVDNRVLEYLARIGSIKYQGVTSESINNENVSMQIGNFQLSRHHLHLIEKRLVEMCVVPKAQHLSNLIIQEFAAAIWLSRLSWWDQCLSVRFMLNAEYMFSLFSCILRLMCGLLADQPPEHVTAMLYKYLLHPPTHILDLPECVQFRFESSSFFSHTGWDTFTENFLQLCSLLVMFGIYNYSIPDLFKKCKRYFPNPISFYLQSSVYPDQWHCFINCFQFLEDVHLLYFDTEFFTPIQLLDLLENIQGCKVKLIAIKLARSDDAKIISYTEMFQHIQLHTDTKVCFGLTGCSLNESKTTGSLFSCSNRNRLTLSLHCEEVSSDSLNMLVNELYSCENLSYWHVGNAQLEALLPALSSATRIIGLHLHYIPINYHEQLFSMLPELTLIRELTWVTKEDGYALLPHITHLSLSYLQVRTFSQLPDRELRDSTIQVLEKNGESLRGLVMYRLMEVGMYHFKRLVNSIQSCSNLVQLELHNSYITKNDGMLWFSLVCNLLSLAYLELFSVSLADTGMLHLCRGLLFHPVIKGLVICFSKLSSNSCEPLTKLIPTLSKLKKIQMNELSTPDPDPVKLLEQTADQYGIQHFL